MVIFDVGAEPPAIQAVVDRILETIRASEGVPGHVDRWGRRPFAYEVKHRREGYYVVIEFTGTSRTVADLDRLLSLADEALRHKVIRMPDRVVRRARRAGGDRSASADRRSVSAGTAAPGRGAPARATGSSGGAPRGAAAPGAGGGPGEPPAPPLPAQG